MNLIRRNALTTLLALLSCAMLVACDSGPKTYDDCMLLASRNSDSDRQFNTMAKSCKERFGHTLPLRPPPVSATKSGEPPEKKP